MSQHFFPTFCLRLAAGMLLGLMVLPPKVLASRFYRIQFVIVLGLLAAAGMAAGDFDCLEFWIFLGLAAGACMAGSLFWSAEDVLVGSATLVAGVAALVVGGVLLQWTPATDLAGGIALGLDNASAAALLGMTMTAMLLGHWYLIAPHLSIQPLQRLVTAIFLALALRTVVAGWELWPLLDRADQLDRITWMWLATRWLVGLVGVLLLTLMAWQTTRIRATQSATGILYVVVIFTFFGELTAQLLQGHLASPPSEV